jgi:hypothetical protein
MIYSFWINFKYNKYYIHTKLIYVYIIYIFVLVFFSSNIFYSLKIVLKSFTPLFYFGAAIVFVNDYKDLNRLFKSMIILGYLFIANMIISTIFNLGGGNYSKDETEFLQTGNVYSEGLNSMGYYLIMIPAIIQVYPFKSYFRKLAAIFSAIGIFIILLLVMKRGALLVVLIGYLVILYFAEFKQKRKLVRILVLSSAVLILTFPLYENLLLSRYNVRKDRMQMNSYKTEGRFTENTLVINDIFYSGNTMWLLFGHDVLNSPGNYGGGAFGSRQLHNDYAQVLNGSGLTGLCLYLLMNISILIFYLRLKRRILLLGLFGGREKLLNVIFWAFFLAYFALGISGSISSLVYNVIRFMFLGAIIGVFKNIPYLAGQEVREPYKKIEYVKILSH